MTLSERTPNRSGNSGNPHKHTHRHTQKHVVPSPLCVNGQRRRDQRRKIKTQRRLGLEL